MTSLRAPPPPVEMWRDLITGYLSIGEAAALLQEPEFIVRANGVPGYRHFMAIELTWSLEIGRPFTIKDEKAFLKYLRMYHTDVEIELFNAAMTIALAEKIK